MEQSKNQTLTDLFNSPKLAEMLGKHNAGAGAEDLKSELFAVLCEKPDDFICGLAEKNQLLYYATAIVQRMVFQTGGRFHRRYRTSCYELGEYMVADVSDGREELEAQLSKLDHAINNDLHWVEKEILRIYQQQGSVAKVSQKTKINKRQIERVMATSRTKLRTSMEGKLMGNYVCASIDLLLDLPENVTPENINDILEEAADFIRQKVEGRSIPSKTMRDAFIKKIEPAKLKRVI